MSPDSSVAVHSRPHAEVLPRAAARALRLARDAASATTPSSASLPRHAVEVARPPVPCPQRPTALSLLAAALGCPRVSRPLLTTVSRATRLRVRPSWPTSHGPLRKAVGRSNARRREHGHSHIYRCATHTLQFLQSFKFAIFALHVSPSRCARVTHVLPCIACVTSVASCAPLRGCAAVVRAPVGRGDGAGLASSGLGEHTPRHPPPGGFGRSQ